MTLFGLALGAMLLLASGLRGGRLLAGAGAAGAMAAMVLISAPALLDQTYERLLFKLKFTPRPASRISSRPRAE